MRRPQVVSKQREVCAFFMLCIALQNRMELYNWKITIKHSLLGSETGYVRATESDIRSVIQTELQYAADHAIPLKISCGRYTEKGYVPLTIKPII